MLQDAQVLSKQCQRHLAYMRWSLKKLTIFRFPGIVCVCVCVYECDMSLPNILARCNVYPIIADPRFFFDHAEPLTLIGTEKQV